MKKSQKCLNLKSLIILITLLLLYIITSARSYTNAVCADISNTVFRLHVIANSNSDEDQNLKYVVRDKILAYINSISLESTSKNEVIQLANDNLNYIQNIAQEAIYEQGFNYPVTVQIGNFAFPTKTYGDITFPPGYYDALKVEIGKAIGQNWWCVMFPPLCFVDVSSGIVPEESKEIMKESLSEEEYSLISENTGNVQIKFKLVEVLQNLSIGGIFM